MNSSPTKDFDSAGNIVRTDKNFSVKERFVVNDTETKMDHGQKIRMVSVPSVYSAVLNDFLVHVPSVAVAPTITLPPASVAGFGKVYVVKDASGSAATTTITIAAREGDVINNDYTTSINTNYGSVRLYVGGGSAYFTY